MESPMESEGYRDGVNAPADLGSALELLERAPAPFPWRERLSRLERAAEALEGRVVRLPGGGLGEDAPAAPPARTVAALAEAREGWGFRFRGDEPGLALCAPDWRELLEGGFVRIATELIRGRPVLLCGDERYPELAALLREVLLDVGFAPETVVLTGGARSELVRSALAAGRVRSLSASASTQRIVELRRLCEPYGLDHESLRSLRSSGWMVGPSDDVPSVARIVATRSFGPDTLGGQLPGQVSRAFVPQKLYSAFVEHLLEAVESRAELRGPFRMIDRDAVRAAQRAWIQGLDEGATMITGGEEEMSADPLLLPPTVFCNVESHMRAARRQEPLPVLCLLRTT